VAIDDPNLIFITLAQFLLIWHRESILTKLFIMKTKFIPAIIVTLILTACGSNPFGQKVKEPFRGNAYESNNRFFRGTGKGESSQDNIARSKADLDAKAQLAGQVNTTMKQVADQYLGQTENERAADVADKFQSLVRQTMNTSIADLRKIGEQKYFDKKSNKYTVFMAYEIKKNAMFRFMKKQAKTDKTIDERQMKIIDEILDQQIKESEEEDN
jgi:hypothetical protein